MKGIHPPHGAGRQKVPGGGSSIVLARLYVATFLVLEVEGSEAAAWS